MKENFSETLTHTEQRGCQVSFSRGGQNTSACDPVEPALGGVGVADF